MEKKRVFSVGEEISHSITHGIGSILSIAALIILVVFASRQNDVWKIVSFSIYGISLVLLYLSSTLYHSLSFTKANKVFQRIDHSMIFVLIAGTYTPVLLIALRDSLGWVLFGLIWGLAILGIVLKNIFFKKLQILSLILYLIMGWLVVFAIKPLLESVPFGMMIWFLAGGLSYTIGVVFYVWKKLPYSHFIWHLFVLGGSITHFLGIFFYLI
jgi:hemolysin III